ncbi:MAG: hypothetical protein AVDCRST_MAG60-2000, partial [uncultured Nocardioides sp.]
EQHHRYFAARPGGRSAHPGHGRGPHVRRCLHCCSAGRRRSAGRQVRRRQDHQQGGGDDRYRRPGQGLLHAHQGRGARRSPLHEGLPAWGDQRRWPGHPLLWHEDDAHQEDQRPGADHCACCCRRGRVRHPQPRARPAGPQPAGSRDQPQPRRARHRRSAGRGQPARQPAVRGGRSARRWPAGRSARSAEHAAQPDPRSAQPRRL